MESDDFQASSDELQASLAALSRLSTGTLGLEDLLVQVATFAVQAIPNADGAGLTMIEHDRGDTIVASAPFVREIDAIQYGIGEGPCISAVAERATVRSGSLGGEPRWPRFGPRAGRMGIMGEAWAYLSAGKLQPPMPGRCSSPRTRPPAALPLSSACR